MNKNKRVAKKIVNYSLHLKKGDKLFLEVTGEENFALGAEVKSYAEKKHISVFCRFSSMEEKHKLWRDMTSSLLSEKIKVDGSLMRECQGYCSISGEQTFVLPPEKEKFKDKYFIEVHEKIRLKKPWVLTQVPNHPFENVPIKTMQDVFYRSCCLDYGKLRKHLEPLKELMEKTDKVHIIAPETDLIFSIKNIPAVICTGECNLPDGEIYTAPVKTSVNGKITYNTPSRMNGVVYQKITLFFKDGKIVKETGGEGETLSRLFDTDEGARYVGEFSFGVNPKVLFPMGSILFDEKIRGSIHFTPGCCYDDAYNGNKSALHWDLVQIQTSKYGGGEIWFDDVLIRKDGKFVPKTLRALN